jgi:phage gpG-like protein
LVIDVDAYVNLRDVENGLRRMQLAGKDLRPLFRRVQGDLRADQKQHAKEEKGPDGKWPSLDPDTLAKRTRQGQGRPHRGKWKRRRRSFGRMLGKLPRAFAITYSESWIAATSRVKWSGAHSGGIVGHGSHLPDRTFLWASSGLLAIVSRKAVDYLVGAWDK